MGSKLGPMLLLFGAVSQVLAAEGEGRAKPQSSSSIDAVVSSSSVPDFSIPVIPDSLTEQLISTAQSGFGYGFGLATAFILGSGGIVLILHLINRGAGR